MKTSIVYVLVSSSKDIYLEQAYVSMYSAKYYMPDSHIILLTDKITEKTFVGVRKKKLNMLMKLLVLILIINIQLNSAQEY